MKIIDKNKDYYDYLVGIWGMDEKIVYDRRGSNFFRQSIIKYQMCGEYATYDSILETAHYIKVRFGNATYHFIKESDGKWCMPEKLSSRSAKGFYTVTSSNPTVDNTKEYEYPVEITIWYYEYGTREYISFSNPILMSYTPIINIPSFIPAETAWNQIYNYISSQYDTEIKDTRTDIQKLESAGFDKRTSFRNV